MALASKVGSYAGGDEASGPDLSATLDSFLARINAVTLEQMTADSVGTTQIINSAVTLSKVAAGTFTADATGRGKFANSFVTRALQEENAKGAGSYIRYAETQSSGVVPSPKDSTGGSWVTRGINGLNDEESVGAGTPSSGVFTLPPGKYYANIFAVQGVSVANGKVRLRDTTGGTTVVISESVSGTTHTVLTGSGIFTLSISSSMALQHWTSLTSTNGFGIPVSSGEAEIYSRVELWKVSD